MADAADDRVRDSVARSFTDIRDRFESCASSGDAEQIALLREWMRPVANLVGWPEEARPRTVVPQPANRARPVVSERDLLTALGDPDGEWAPKKQALRDVDWEAHDSDGRERLSHALVTHPDPAVRDAAAEPLAAWSKTGQLLGLIADPSFAVRKSAVYHLGLVPPDPAIAVPAWEYMLGAAGTMACEGLQTYAVHAPVEQARERLVALALADRRECIRTRAVSCLVDLGAVDELDSLMPLLREPPGVSWALHISVLDGLRRLGLPAPELSDLAAVDNLDLVQSVVALRCSPR